MVKISSIYKFIIIVCVALMMGLHLMTPTEIIGKNTIRIGMGILGICTGFCAFLCLGKKNEFRKYYVIAQRYIFLFTCVVVLIGCYTWIHYQYSISELLIAVSPYMYVYYAFPLIYIFIIDGSPFIFLKRVVNVVLVFLLIKSFAWYLYNFKGITIFPRWIFEYGEKWIRYGLLRVNVGYLNGVTVLTCAFLGIRRKGNRLYALALVGILLFLNYITRMRYLLAATLVAVFLYLYFSIEKDKMYIARRAGIVMTILYVLTSDSFLNFVYSFSSSGELSWSTAARFLTIEHYWDIIKNSNLILGVGFLVVDNSNALVLLGTRLRYYLEDIGIIGGFFRFGLMSIIVYGQLFFYSVKACKNVWEKSDSYTWAYTISLCVYMIASCVLLNIYDMQRCLDVPFYLAFFSYEYGMSLNESYENSVMRVGDDLVCEANGGL